MKTVWALVATAIVTPWPAMAQTARPESAVAYSRLDTVAQLVLSATVCTKLGYSTDESALEELQKSTISEAIRSGMTETEAEASLARVLNDNLRLFDSELSATAAFSDGPALVRSLNSFLDRHARRCSEGLRDPAFRTVLIAPSPPEYAAARKAWSDELLEPAGYASWQTPALRGQAELLYAVGACKAHLSSVRSAELSKQIAIRPPESDTIATLRFRYLSKWYLEGLQGAADLDFDAAQCAKVLAARGAPKS